MKNIGYHITGEQGLARWDVYLASCYCQPGQSGVSVSRQSLANDCNFYLL